MIQGSHQRLPTQVQGSAMLVGRLPVQSAQDDIHLTSGRAHRYESSEADQASLQKPRRNLLIAGQTEEMLQQMNHGLQSSQPGPVTEDQESRILEKPTQGPRHLTPLQHQ